MQIIKENINFLSNHKVYFLILLKLEKYLTFNIQIKIRIPRVIDPISLKKVMFYKRFNLD